MHSNRAVKSVVCEGCAKGSEGCTCPTQESKPSYSIVQPAASAAF